MTYGNLTRDQLRAACKDRSIVGYGKFSVTQLVTILEEADKQKDLETTKDQIYNEVSETDTQTSKEKSMTKTAEVVEAIATKKVVLTPEERAEKRAATRAAQDAAIAQKEADKAAKKADKEAKKEADKEAKKAAKEAAKMPTCNGVQRPKPSTVCGAIWAILDDGYANGGKVFSGAELLDLLPHENRNTITTQRAMFCKYYGLTTPRKAKEETPTEPTEPDERDEITY